MCTLKGCCSLLAMVCVHSSVSNYSLCCSSVDGKIRRYDIRFGKLVTDTVGRMLKQFEVDVIV